MNKDMSLTNLQTEDKLNELTLRNYKVDLDKKWETSNFRKVLVLVTTYFLASITMFAIGDSKPFISSLIPTLGYFLSTFSFGFIKKIWISNLESKN